MMRVGLFGFTFGHENMGCQALTCAFLDMLQRNFPDEVFEIINFSAEKTLGNIPKLFPKMKFANCNVSLKKIKPEFLKLVKQCDIVFDETYGDGFSDIYFTKSMYKTTFVKWLCAGKVPFILTPQTYGPFKHKSLEWMAGKAIKRATYVYARDEISAEYARKISGREVTAVTDLALALPFQKIKDEKQKKIGLNISGLLWQGGFDGRKNQFGLLCDYKEYCRSLIQYGLKHGYEVHLISHVTKAADSNRVIPDGDYRACETLNEEFPQTVLAPCFDSPYEVKNYIATMDIFVGARMHATIAAFSSGVVTIPFAYSRKFKGLYDKLNYIYYVDGTKNDTKTSVYKTIEMIENSNELLNAQTMAMTVVKKNLKCFEEELVTLINEILYR